jgi:hypothetical protein
VDVLEAEEDVEHHHRHQVKKMEYVIQERRM